MHFWKSITMLFCPFLEEPILYGTLSLTYNIWNHIPWPMIFWTLSLTYNNLSLVLDLQCIWNLVVDLQKFEPWHTIYVTVPLADYIFNLVLDLHIWDLMLDLHIFEHCPSPTIYWTLSLTYNVCKFVLDLLYIESCPWPTIYVTLFFAYNIWGLCLILINNRDLNVIDQQ